MAKGRFLSKTIATSRQLDGLSWRAELLFYRCIPHLDRDGRMDGDPVLVKSIVAPRNSKLPATAIPRLIHELALAELVVVYEVEGVAVLAFPKFREHQTGMKYEREAPSRLPPKSGDISGLTPDQGRTSSGFKYKRREDEGDIGGPTPPAGSASWTSEQRQAAKAYRGNGGADPRAVDAIIRELAEGCSHGPGFGWPVVGLAILEMRGTVPPPPFSTVVLLAYCRRLRDRKPESTTVTDDLGRTRPAVREGSRWRFTDVEGGMLEITP